MMHPDLHITQIPAISAIYFGLLNSGYDFYHLERDAAFWSWFDQFPEALKQVMDSPHFVQYLQWERDWIAEQNSRYANELQQIADLLHRSVDKYHSPVKNMQIVLNPIKCVYSADYHLVDDRFVFSSGRFQMASMVHEFLHHVVHPIVVVHQKEILSNPMEYPEIDRSYYAAGQANAFEEYMVRQLTQDAMNDRLPNDLHHYLRLLLKL